LYWVLSQAHVSLHTLAAIMDLGAVQLTMRAESGFASGHHFQAYSSILVPFLRQQTEFGQIQRDHDSFTAGEPPKNELKHWLKQCWCIPPEASVAFVWRMEDVLEVYTRPYDPRFPQVCMDESAKQLLQDKREPLPMQPGQPERVDYTFEAAGMRKIFLACEPLAGKRARQSD